MKSFEIPVSNPTSSKPGSLPAVRAACHRALERTARENRGLLSWLTGPSHSADIEKELVLGAHGPQELHAALYQQDN